MNKYDSEKVVKAIHRNTRRKYSAEERNRIVLDGLSSEDSIAELCGWEGVNQNIYYCIMDRRTLIKQTTLQQRKRENLINDTLSLIRCYNWDVSLNFQTCLYQIF